MKIFFSGLYGFITYLFIFCFKKTVVYVQDVNKQPISGVEIIVQSFSAMTEKSLTDVQGRAILKNLPRANMIWLSKEKYEDGYINYPKKWPLYIVLRPL